MTGTFRLDQLGNELRTIRRLAVGRGNIEADWLGFVAGLECTINQYRWYRRIYKKVLTRVKKKNLVNSALKATKRLSTHLSNPDLVGLMRRHETVAMYRSESTKAGTDNDELSIRVDERIAALFEEERNAIDRLTARLGGLATDLELAKLDWDEAKRAAKSPQIDPPRDHLAESTYNLLMRYGVKDAVSDSSDLARLAAEIFKIADDCDLDVRAAGKRIDKARKRIREYKR